MRAIDEASSPSRREGGPGEGRASTRAASGARRAPAVVNEARNPSFDPNDDPMMTAVRWTNDVSSADTDDATGPPALPIGTSTVEEGQDDRRERVVVDVGNISASRSRQIGDETLNAPTSRRTNFHGNKAKDAASSPSRIEGRPGEGRECIRAAAGARRAPTAVDEARHPTTTPMTIRFDGRTGRTTCPRPLQTTRRARRRCPWARRRRRSAGAAGSESRSTWEA